MHTFLHTHPNEVDVQRVMNELRMDRMQAIRHLQQLMAIQAHMARTPKTAAEILGKSAVEA